jgi:aspartate aminotransferase-like enzyme
MEGAVSKVLCRGDKAIVVRGGKFGERWGEICKAYGIEFIPIDVPWGRAVDPKEIKRLLETNRSIRAVYTQASETSTGARHPIREIGEIVKKYASGHRRRCHHRDWVFDIPMGLGA